MSPVLARGLSLLLILGAVAATFGPTLDGGLFMEDHYFVRTIHAEGGWARFVDDLHGNWLGFAGYPYYRPVVTASLALDHAVYGVEPFGYHLTNLLLHALNAILVGLLARRLIPRAGRVGAILGALLYAVHPVHPNAVGWIAARSDLLVGMSTLATLLLFHRGWTRGSRPALRLGSVVFAAGLFAKESGVIALPLVLLLPVAVDWRTRLRGVAFPAGCLLAYFAIRLAFVHSTIDLHGASASPSVSMIAESLLRQLWEVIHPGWVTLLPLALLVGFALLTFVRRPTLFGWCVALLVLSVAPVIPIVGNLDPELFSGYSRYWYVAVAAFALVVAGAAGVVDGRRRHAVVVIAAILIGVYGWTSHRRCRDELVHPAAVASRVAAAVAAAPRSDRAIDVVWTTPDARYAGARLTPLAFTAGSSRPLYPVDAVSLAWLVGQVGGFRPLRLFAVRPDGTAALVREFSPVPRWRERVPDGPFRFDVESATDIDGAGRSPLAFEEIALGGIRGTGTLAVQVEFEREDGTTGVATRSIAVGGAMEEAIVTFRDDPDMLNAVAVRTIRIERPRPIGVTGAEQESMLGRALSVERIVVRDRPAQSAIERPVHGADVRPETVQVRWRSEAPRELAVRTLSAIGLSPGVGELPLRPIDGVTDRLRRELAVSATLGHGQVWWFCGDSKDRVRYKPHALRVRP